MALTFRLHVASIMLIFFAASFGFEEDDFFGDMREIEREKKDAGSGDSGDVKTFYVSQSIKRLKDGSELIRKESDEWAKDSKTGKMRKIRKVRDVKRLANGTVVQIEDGGSGDGLTDQGLHVTKIDCINGDDCKEEQYCDELSYKCKKCLKLNHTCTMHQQCCKGSMCRKGKCVAITGREGDPCNSNKDCKANHCCAYDNGKEVCKPFLKEGEACGEQSFAGFPSFFASRFLQGGKRVNCPCLKGLKCKARRSYFMYKKQRCVKEEAKKPKEAKKEKKQQRKKKGKKQHVRKTEERNEVDELPNETMMGRLDYDDEMNDKEIDDSDGDMDAFRDADDDNDDDDNEDGEDFHKRSLTDEHFMDDGMDAENIFESIPRLIKGVLKNIFD